jgi:hypothetical protein
MELVEVVLSLLAINTMLLAGILIVLIRIAYASGSTDREINVIVNILSIIRHTIGELFTLTLSGKTVNNNVTAAPVAKEARVVAPIKDHAILLKFDCAYCGKKCQRLKSQTLRSKRLFCSSKCFGLSQRRPEETECESNQGQQE